MWMPWSFMNTPEEWHSFVIGWAEICCPWPPRFKITWRAEFKPYKEWHYYLFGRVMGLLTFVLVVMGIVKLGFVIY